MIIAGFGFRSGANLAGFQDALTQARALDPVPPAPGAMACLVLKRSQLVLDAIADALQLPIIWLDQADVLGLPVISHSAASLAAYGTPSVAEACALAAAGVGGQLLGPRVVSGDKMVTCALARAADHVRTSQTPGAAAPQTGA